MKTNCNHCIESCKTFGKTDCKKYNSIAFQDYEYKLKEAYRDKNYELAREIQSKLDYFYYGIK